MKQPTRPSKRIALFLLIGVSLLCVSSNVYAQSKQPPGAPEVSSDPQNTSASYGDWVVRCSRVSIENQPQRVCEVAQTIIIQGNQAPVAEVAIGRMKKGDPLNVTLVLPINVSFPSAPNVLLDGQPGLELAWRRCLPNGCYADAVPKDEVFRGWRGAKTNGRIETKDAFGRNVVVTLSFRGLQQALDALNKEP